MRRPYSVSKCANGECGYPMRQCSKCLQNASAFGWPRSVLSNPHGTYQSARGLNPHQSYTKPFAKP